MKLVRILLLFLIFLFISAFVLSLLAPTQQTVQKSILINAKPSVVYQQMMLLQNFTNWSVWGRADSTIKYSAEGKDGVVGSKIKWQGSSVLAGKGEVVLTGLEENRLITHDVVLLEPQPLKAQSRFDVLPVGNQTEVKWTFTVPAKRPLNIFNIFYNLEKEKGKDFATGLLALKLLVEKAPLRDPAALNVTLTRFSFTNYAAIRQTVLWDDYAGFFNPHFDHLNNDVLKNKLAVRTALFFENDEQLRQSSVAAALPLPVGYKPQLNDPEEFIEVPASKAVSVVFKGKDEVKQQAYQLLDSYITGKKLKLKKPIIEQYLSTDTLPETKIIYLVE